MAILEELICEVINDACNGKTWRPQNLSTRIAKAIRGKIGRDESDRLHNYFRGVVSSGCDDDLQIKEDSEMFEITLNLKNLMLK